MEDVVKATGSESGTAVSTQDDSYGYRWMILRNAEEKPSVEDLAVGINAVSGSIEAAGHGDRVLCAVFAFTQGSAPSGSSSSGSGRIYFIYNYKRGYWYPFVPVAGKQGPDGGERSTERELQLKAQLADELPIEPELERWFPLWGIPI